MHYFVSSLSFLVFLQSDSSGHFLQCEFAFRDVVFRVVCVYATNRNPDHDSFLDDISGSVEPLVPTALAGDFNTVFDTLMDRCGSVALAGLFRDACCVNIWRYLHPSAQGFTWSQADGLVSSRIDLFSCPYIWVASASSCDILPCPLSDHCTLAFSLDPPGVVPPAPGLWKLNASVLLDMEYCSTIKNFWVGWRSRKGDFPSLAKWWDAGNAKIKGLTASHCVRPSQKLSQSRTLLSRLTGHLKEWLDSGMTSCLGPYQSVLSNLAQLDLEAARVLVLSLAHVSNGLKRGRCRLEKKRSMDRWVSALSLPDDSIASDLADLCSSFSDFYSSLYSASEMDASPQETLLPILPTPLPPEQLDLCEGLLSTYECHQALVGMAKGKAPRSNGLLAEFYCKFWDLLGPDLIELLNFCFNFASLALSQRRGVISLLFKKGDRLDSRNWCPISLLNVDYKTASRVITGRLHLCQVSVAYFLQSPGDSIISIVSGVHPAPLVPLLMASFLSVF